MCLLDLLQNLNVLYSQKKFAITKIPVSNIIVQYFNSTIIIVNKTVFQLFCLKLHRTAFLSRARYPINNVIVVDNFVWSLGTVGGLIYPVCATILMRIVSRVSSHAQRDQEEESHATNVVFFRSLRHRYFLSRSH